MSKIPCLMEKDVLSKMYDDIMEGQVKDYTATLPNVINTALHYIDKNIALQKRNTELLHENRRIMQRNNELNAELKLLHEKIKRQQEGSVG